MSTFDKSISIILYTMQKIVSLQSFLKKIIPHKQCQKNRKKLIKRQKVYTIFQYIKFT